MKFTICLLLWRIFSTSAKSVKKPSLQGTSNFSGSYFLMKFSGVIKYCRLMVPGEWCLTVAHREYSNRKNKKEIKERKEYKDRWWCNVMGSPVGELSHSYTVGIFCKTDHLRFKPFSFCQRFFNCHQLSILGLFECLRKSIQSQIWLHTFIFRFPPLNKVYLQTWKVFPVYNLLYLVWKVCE